MKRSMGVVSCVTVVLATLAPTAPARSNALKDATGTIVFDRWIGVWGFAAGDLYSMASDGTGEQRLTSDGTASELHAAWSPDGNRLAYMSDSGASPSPTRLQGWKPGLHVYVSDADGTNARRITSEEKARSWMFPSWSPNGNKLALASYDPFTYEGAIYSVNADGSGLRKITRGPYDSQPAWSPDGKWIAIRRWVMESSTWQLHLVRPNGSGLRRLTQGPNVWSPEWSPDSRYLAYLAYKGDGNGVTYSGNLHVIEVATGKIRQLTTGSGVDLSPCWSPDGSRIGFSRTLINAWAGVYVPRWVTGSATGYIEALIEEGTDLYMINADGTEMKQLTNTPHALEFGCDWK